MVVWWIFQGMPEALKMFDTDGCGVVLWASEERARRLGGVTRSCCGSDIFVASVLVIP